MQIWSPVHPASPFEYLIPWNSPSACAQGLAVDAGLTTSNGQILDHSGNAVTLKGFALSGFENLLTMSGNLNEGKDSIAHDWDTVMYRYTLLFAKPSETSYCSTTYYFGTVLASSGKAKSISRSQQAAGLHYLLITKVQYHIAASLRQWHMVMILPEDDSACMSLQG